MASVFAAFLLGCFSATLAGAKPGFLVKPPATWVRTTSIQTDRRSASTTATGSTTLVLDDNEIRVGEKSVERYYHYAQRIETTAGLDELSQLKFYFEPSYQQLTIHFIRIHRGDTIIPALKPSEVKTIQEEEELDQQLYNGTFASVVFMNDLRVGDVVDYAYTVSGENPVMGGRFADRVYLADYRMAQKLTVRLLWPTQRSLNLRNHNTDLNPAIQTIGGETEYLWERNDVPALSSEDSTPAWADPFPAVDISEFKSWEEVVHWALPLYKISQPKPELGARIEKWKSELQSPEARALAALRFVQDEIRYLGIELGRYSHQPNPPDKVFARRFGDCKDKSMLLAVILNAMGIEAAPALVNSRAGKRLDSKQPSPFVFNHVIVQAKLAGKTYWWDPTISFQRGSLTEYYDPPYATALVLREGSNALEQIPPPSPDSGNTTVHGVYTISDYSLPVSFVVTTIYSGSVADGMRSRLSSQSLEELGKANLNYYANITPSIRLEGVHEVNDDQKANVITVLERYIIERLWSEPQHYFFADQVYYALTKPNVAKRSTPFEINHPASINQTIEIVLPQRMDPYTDSGTISDKALQMTYRQSTIGPKIKLEYSLRSLDDHVPVEAIDKHLDTVDRMRNFVGIEIPRGRDALIRTSASANPYTVLKVLAGLLLPLLVVLFVLGYRRRARVKQTNKWAQQAKHKPGASPETAIPVRALVDLTAYLAAFKCLCGNYPYQPESPPPQERFTYDGRRFAGVRMKCSACGHFSDLYFSADTLEGG